MVNKFEKVPLDEDTVILIQKETKLGKRVVLYQKWFWDGITAESIIFDNDDIGDLREDEVIDEVRAWPTLRKDSQITIKRSEAGFTFVNFNFEME